MWTWRQIESPTAGIGQELTFANGWSAQLLGQRHTPAEQGRADISGSGMHECSSVTVP